MWRLVDKDRRKLERLADSMMEALTDKKLNLSLNDKLTIQAAHNETLKFIEQAGINATIEEITSKQAEIEKKVNPIINKVEKTIVQE
jgi:molecular chaperone DnaK (HSP70)